MAAEYSVPTIRTLEQEFHRQKVLRPRRVQRYDPGEIIDYDVRGIIPSRRGRAKVLIEQFVGGGYAGQVYRIRLLALEAPDGPIAGLEPHRHYALKILIPPTRFAVWFRSLVYALAFQGPFSPQTNPDASRAGALWQKFIRRGARIRLGSEQRVVDIHATLVDPNLGSCGEISEWVDGRMWRFEVDDNLDARLRWKPGTPDKDVGSPEYRAKKSFMHCLVELMHEMGAVELARQYEWWTCKSQPNTLKRRSNEASPSEGLVAVDFRAGLALLPFGPMCPADFKLIPKGFARRSVVQFDRGNMVKLKDFVNQHRDHFADMTEGLEELEAADLAYRESLPDITHHSIRLLTRPSQWLKIMRANVRGWTIRRIVDRTSAEKLDKNHFLATAFWLLGLVPFLGRSLRRLWAHAGYRRHYGRMLTSPGYFMRAGRARIAESLIRWHRSGRVDDRRAISLSRRPLRYASHLPLCLLPPGIHRFMTDRKHAKRVLNNIFVRPVRLYFNAEARERWLRDIISQGQEKGMLTDAEADRIQSRLEEPFIQKYLKSLAVHVCTLPVTQVVSVLVALIYIRLHPELAWQQAMIHAGLILGLFQVVPVSPGSLVRGLYVTALVLRERSFKDYNIAFGLSFFKYIGYLAFPIQMAYRYPDLARFMAAHWATGAVHIVPVFGEHGALLEHAVFDLFYNYPLTLRRRIRRRKRFREGRPLRRWPFILCTLGGVTALGVLDYVTFRISGTVPRFGEVWGLALWIPLFAAVAAVSWAGGMPFAKRLLWAMGCGITIGLCSALVNTSLSRFFFSPNGDWPAVMRFLGEWGPAAAWRAFLFALLAFAGASVAETRPLRKN